MLILRQAFRLTVPILTAYWLIGLGYGIYATELGLSWWVPLVTAACVYSGSAEFILASMLLGAFRPVDAVLMAVLVGARHLLPFLVFRPDRPTPPFIVYLGKWLGSAVFGLLVVYCLKDAVSTRTHLVPMLVCMAVTMALQVWRHQMMLSMAVGTGLYMILLRVLGG